MRTKNSQLFKITSVDPIQSSNHRPLARYYGTASSNLFFELRNFFSQFYRQNHQPYFYGFLRLFYSCINPVNDISELCCSISYRRSNTFSLKNLPPLLICYFYGLSENSTQLKNLAVCECILFVVSIGAKSPFSLKAYP